MLLVISYWLLVDLLFELRTYTEEIRSQPTLKLRLVKKTQRATESLIMSVLFSLCISVPSLCISV